MEYPGVGLSRVCVFVCLLVCLRWQGLKQWIMRKFNIQNDKLLQQRAPKPTQTPQPPIASPRPLSAFSLRARTRASPDAGACAEPASASNSAPPQQPPPPRRPSPPPPWRAHAPARPASASDAAGARMRSPVAGSSAMVSAGTNGGEAYPTLHGILPNGRTPRGGQRGAALTAAVLENTADVQAQWPYEVTARAWWETCTISH